MASAPSFQEFDIDTWYRKDAYHYFKTFGDPFFNITANIEITNLLGKSKERQQSFFLLSLHASLLAVNSINEFKLRFYEDRVVRFDSIDGGCTILYDDNSFGFGYFDFIENENDFIENGLSVLDNTKKDGSFDPRLDDTNLIHHSSIPWISFTAFEHAKRHKMQDSVPKIVFGKYFKEGSKYLLPISVAVNHALADGYHVALYFKTFEKYANSKEQI